MTTTAHTLPMASGRPLAASTQSGADLLALAGWLADELAARASGAGRDGGTIHDGLALAREHGYLAAPVPEQLGGLGVASAHDMAAASRRLARADADLAVAVDRHWIALADMERRRRAAIARGDEQRAAQLAASLEAVAHGRASLLVSGTYAVRRPARAEAAADGGGTRWTLRVAPAGEREPG